MYFPTAFVLAPLPFLVLGAVPVQSSARSGLSMPLSKCSTLSNADGVVDVQNLQASIYHTVAKFEQGFKAFESNTGKPHPLVSRQALPSKPSRGSTISLTDYQNALWYGNIYVGTPATPHTVIFDTGSADFFLPGPSCSNCVGHQIYNPTQSSTAKDLREIAIFSYYTAEVFGEVFTDDVFVGGIEAANLTLLLISAYFDNLNSNNTYFGKYGLMGMGFKEIATLNAAPFFETLVNQGQLEEPIFGFYLADSDSELIIGGRDTSRYSGNLTYVNVDKKGYWQTTFDVISVNGNDISVSTQDAIIDTGTTAILGDQESISNIYAKIPGSNLVPNTDLWTIPCTTNVTVSMTFGNTTFNISPKTYNFGTISNTTCVGGFSTVPTYTGFWIIGDVFLRNVYTEFDYGKLRVGFAQLANE